MKLQTTLALMASAAVSFSIASAAVVSTTGDVVETDSLYPPETDGVIYVFDEQQGVAFDADQVLDFGSIEAGTLVDSHYVQFDPLTPIGLAGPGSIAFSGPILGVITGTDNLNMDLGGGVTSDEYFGLANLLGAYPAGAFPSARGLGSPQDDLVINLGTLTLMIDSLEIPQGSGGNLDGFRVLTAASVEDPAPVPGAMILFGSALALGAWRRRKA